MNKKSLLPTPIANVLMEKTNAVDNLIADSMEDLKVLNIFSRSKIVKRSGKTGLSQIIYALLIMPLLNLENIWCFCGKFLNVYITGGKDVLYDFMNRENIKWDAVQLYLSRILYLKLIANSTKRSAFVVDDTLKQRRGKKVQAMSSHFDHNQSRSVMGQQILQLGYASDLGFLPLQSRIFVGKTRAVEANRTFLDKRSSVAKSYREAHQLNKHQMLARMLKKVLRFGFQSFYLIADAWFGTKANLALAIDNGLTAIFMMKRGKSKFTYQGQSQTLKTLYRNHGKRLKTYKKKGYSYFTLQVQYNLADSPKSPDRWIDVKLVFSKARKAPKSSWVVLLSTDPHLEDDKIFEIYALRWCIEVYFKEVKQYFGFLKEQTSSYVVHYASIHLAAMRYLLIYRLLLIQNIKGFATIRNQLGLQLEFFTYAALSWELLSVLVNKTIEQTCQHLGEQFIRNLQEDINEQVNQWLYLVLQVDAQSTKNLEVAEKRGLIE